MPHCKPNDLKKLDHCPINDFGQDDRSKWDIDMKVTFFMEYRSEECGSHCNDL